MIRFGQSTDGHGQRPNLGILVLKYLAILTRSSEATQVNVVYCVRGHEGPGVLPTHPARKGWQLSPLVVSSIHVSTQNRQVLGRWILDADLSPKAEKGLDDVAVSSTGTGQHQRTFLRRHLNTNGSYTQGFSDSRMRGRSLNDRPCVLEFV